MKRYILLLLVAVSFGASNVQGSDTFHVTRSDGSFLSFFCNEVESIQFSKTDASGTVHEKYVTQVIETSKGSFYQVPISDIKEVSFDTPPIEPSTYIDLGLSVKWASCNAGASSPEEYGGYYNWNATRYFDLPNEEQMDELCNRCIWEETTLNGVKGFKVIGPSANSIFLPYAGFHYISLSKNQGEVGNYWSSTFNPASFLRFYGNAKSLVNCDISSFYEYSVRPVASSTPIEIITSLVTNISENSAICHGYVDGIENATTPFSFGICYSTSSNVIVETGNCVASSNKVSGNFSVNLIGLKAKTIYYYRAYISYNGKYSFYGETSNFITKDITPSTYIDLGLSVKWASSNVGASSPEDYGSFYNWNDALSFHLPTKAQMEELDSKCTWECTTLNGVNGVKITGTNGNSIFIPSCNSQGYSGYYWSSTPYPYNNKDAYYLYFNINDYRYMGNYIDRLEKFSVRPVSE